MGFHARPLWLQWLCFLTRKEDRRTEAKPGHTGQTKGAAPIPARAVSA